jgi:hypothetical protein
MIGSLWTRLRPTAMVVTSGIVFLGKFSFDSNVPGSAR